MRVLTAPVAGAERRIYVPTHEDDLEGFEEFLRRPRRALAVDTETTGLTIFTPGFRVRLVQFGDTEEAWVLDAHRFADTIREALRRAPVLVAHNATFDVLALTRQGLADLEDLYPRTFDTRTLAHLLDPRLKQEGGVGLGLKDLSAAHVDPGAPDGDKALKAVFRENRWTKETGWARIPLDHPDYLRYAGLDVLLTARLFDVLGAEVKARGLGRLLEFERAVSILTARMEARGILLDVPYAEGLLDYFETERLEGEAEARRWGIEKVSSTAQVAEVLVAAGATLTETTPTGKPKVDKSVLGALAAEGFEAAAAVLRAKQAAKFRTTYVEASLDLRDERNRVHPSIRPLQARTARMSVSSPPLQQLPSGDWRIRRAFIADPGHVIVAADYSQVELRVLAALAKETKMLQAIAEGVDLHDVTAAALFGEGFTKAQRKLAKNVGFGKVYGGGAKTLARTAGVSVDEAKIATAKYDREFPGVKRFARTLVERAEWGKREVVTPSGRRLPLDRDRLYAATNYVVQSTARDVLCQALLDLDEAGLSEFLLLPVHDEVIASVPAEDAKEVSRAIGETMEMDFHGVHLAAEAEVYGPSWGDGYGAPS